MNKPSFLVCAALATCAGAAAAQSSVTLFGVVDLSLRSVKSGGNSIKKLSTNGTTPSRFGLRGAEALGNGYTASFWLEGDISADTGVGGAKLFGRRATVGLAGPVGEVQLGRDTLAIYRNAVQFDPFAYTGVGQIGNLVSVLSTTVTPAGSTTAAATDNKRADNLVSYTLPGGLGGLYGLAQVWAGEGGKGAGNGGRVGYKAGPLDVAASLSNIDVNQGDYRIVDVGGLYDFGPFKLQGQYLQFKLSPTGGALATKQAVWQLGAWVPVSAAGALRASYSKANVYARARQLAVGYVHELSKRTALYGTYATINNQNSRANFVVNDAAALAAPNTALLKSSGYEIGLRHSF